MEYKILIVEDDEAWLAKFNGILERHFGYGSVSRAATFETAERRLGRETYTCLVVDQHLPGGDGAGLIKNLRSGDYEPQTSASTPAILVSGMSPLALDSQLSVYISSAISKYECEERLALECKILIDKFLETEEKFLDDARVLVSKVDDLWYTLTSEEKRVINLAVGGLTVLGISKKIGLADKKVERLLDKAVKKMGMDSVNMAKGVFYHYHKAKKDYNV